MSKSSEEILRVIADVLEEEEGLTSQLSSLGVDWRKLWVSEALSGHHVASVAVRSDGRVVIEGASGGLKGLIDEKRIKAALVRRGFK